MNKTIMLVVVDEHKQVVKSEELPQEEVQEILFDLETYKNIEFDQRGDVQLRSDINKIISKFKHALIVANDYGTTPDNYFNLH